LNGLEREDLKGSLPTKTYIHLDFTTVDNILDLPMREKMRLTEQHYVYFLVIYRYYVTGSTCRYEYVTDRKIVIILES
jgi:hypothetical protein